MANRKKHTNAVPYVALARWIVAAFFLAVVGLYYVYLKNQLHANGKQITKLEEELATLTKQNEIASTKIARLSSRTELQKRLAEGFIKMEPITGDRIVRLKGAEGYASNELRAVANTGVIK